MDEVCVMHGRDEKYTYKEINLSEEKGVGERKPLH
jgi:hypothetical protein